MEFESLYVITFLTIVTITAYYVTLRNNYKIQSLFRKIIPVGFFITFLGRRTRY